MLEAFWISFLAGLFAPIGAVCVLPLYPGFLSYLSNQVKDSADASKKIIVFGWIVTSGVISSMLVIGFIFSFLLQASLTSVIGIISPIAFGLLAIVSIFLVFNMDLSRFLPKIASPKSQNPKMSAYLFGVFFGFIVLPCNPASLVLLFAIVTTVTAFFTNFVHFILFGIGMTTPLLLFAYLSSTRSQQIVTWVARHKRTINLISGILMLIISLYYLFFVFDILGKIL